MDLFPPLGRCESSPNMEVKSLVFSELIFNSRLSSRLLNFLDSTLSCEVYRTTVVEGMDLELEII